MKLVRAHVFIFGSVQGIGFRFSTKHKADALGLKGWVRNYLDYVEAVFEGSENKVNEMIDWCRKGPPTARVEKVEVNIEKYTGEFEEFGIIQY